MKTLPWWKFKREVKRIFDPAGLAVRRPFERLFTIYHDLNFNRRVTVTSTALPTSGKVAVFIIFQPTGISKSIYVTLEYLRSNGYQPIVVCNGQHAQKDIEQLAQAATAVVQRQNVGYDFGGYRDGQKILGNRLFELDRLILMNDSAWFPLRLEDDTIARMEQSGADMIGHIFKTESAQKRGHDHIESHFLMFKGSTVASTAYRNFWKKYAMSDKRVTTIRYGEKQLTQTMLNNGFDCRGLLSREALLETLGKLDDDTLGTYARTIVRHKDKTPSYFTDLMKRWGEPDTRDAFLDWVSTGLKETRQYLVSTTYVEPAMRLGKMGFVKKAKDMHFHMARQRVLDLEKAGTIPKLDPAVRSEMEDLVRRQKAEPHS